MRQDPDIIMVGEIRDLETAEMAIQAALTGHLVLSTLHTNDAPSAITRLLDLGVPAYLLNATLIGVMAQRLVRTLCPHCKQPDRAAPRRGHRAWDGLVAPWKASRPAKIYKPVGCLECRMTGYMGRIGIYEVLLFSPLIRKLVNEKADISGIARAGLQGRHEGAAHQRRDEGRRRPHHHRGSAQGGAAGAGSRRARGLIAELMLLAVLSGGLVYLYMSLSARRDERRLSQARYNETRFRDLTALSADWFWETDAALRTTWISGGATVATFFGETPTYGKRIWELPGVEVDARAAGLLGERLEAQQPFFDLEIARTDKRGARQIHIISGQARLGAAGEFLGYRGVGRDVTEQRRAELALAAAKERLELALGGGNLAEWDYDLATHQVYLGAGWGAFLGGEVASSVSKDTDLFELIHREDRPATTASVLAALKGNIPSHVVDCRVRTEGGGWRWLRVTGQVTRRDPNGRALRMSGTVADIDVQRRAEEGLRETEQRYRLLVELAPDARDRALPRRHRVRQPGRGAPVRRLLAQGAWPASSWRSSPAPRSATASASACATWRPGRAGSASSNGASSRSTAATWWSTAPACRSSSAAGWWFSPCSATSPTRRARARRWPSASSASATSPRPPASSSGNATGSGASPTSPSAPRRCSATRAPKSSAGGRRTSCRWARSAGSRPGCRATPPAAARSATSSTAR